MDIIFRNCSTDRYTPEGRRRMIDEMIAAVEHEMDFIMSVRYSDTVALLIHRITNVFVKKMVEEVFCNDKRGNTFAAQMYEKSAELLWTMEDSDIDDDDRVLLVRNLEYAVTRYKYANAPGMALHALAKAARFMRKLGADHAEEYMSAMEDLRDKQSIPDAADAQATGYAAEQTMYEWPKNK